ncbi:MerR family transcriptional regulator [Aquipuribacter sp. MA13-6]|uniref:MerR family transcriptional regulator n=1 Tax=unclassified Aquipuribacter TaxID=2635084 RepID=UPI003EEAB959
MRRTSVVEAEQQWTVGPAADAVGTTVRTLHHYDAIGLVVPGGRTRAGYRVYTGRDLDRVRQVLVYRELGFALEQVAVLLDGDDDDRTRQVAGQLAAVVARIDRLQQVQVALEEQMERQMSGVDLTQAEKRELFGDTWVENEQEYAAEAEERWGGTDAWAQARSREKSYTKGDWTQMKAEADDIDARFVTAMQAGEPADGQVARDLAEEHRQLICRWHYDCSLEMHAGIGLLFPQRGAPGVPPLQDPRFTRTYEDKAAGLAVYVSDAMQANAATRA